MIFHDHACQRGNILFLILLAVALFAALSYAVTSSMRGGGNDATKEKYESQIAEMLNYLAEIDTAVTRMRLTQNLKPEEISFVYDYKLTDGTDVTGVDNANCTSDTCRVFRQDGGGIVARSFSQYAFQPSWWGAGWGAPGVQDMVTIDWPGTASGDDIAMRIVSLPAAICPLLNAKNGISEEIAHTGTYNPAQYVSNWDTGGLSFSPPSSSLIGKSTVGVVEESAGEKVCHFYHLIFAR